ncbi:MAG: 30S ribosomal protein S4 [Clostridia bacterium]|nr:30S ribosomal protein S4 [Clostridia bacterium]
MARYTGAVCKLCRREGKKLFLKGERCTSSKCSFERRSYAPGQHGQGRKKLTEYGLQLRAKQTARRYYGISESQFRKYFMMAVRHEGVTGDNLLRICESRLDNIVYSLGWATSRAEARQLVTHGHFTVNGKRVDIPSYLCKAGDVVAIKKASLDSEKFKAILEKTGTIPAWLEAGNDNTAKIVNLPEREQIEVPVEEHLIVEFYSR